MANITTLVSLVQSLSKGEKKYFTMQASVQKGTKDYLRLFRLIVQGVDASQLKVAFLRTKHTASYETSCKYLFAILTRYLVQLRQEESPAHQLSGAIMKASLLFEKSLYEEGFLQLQKIRKKAAAQELHLIELSACRMELDYYSQLNYHTITEKELIRLQMHMEDLLRKQKNEQQHHNLYELMKYRRFHGGATRSAQQTAGLNDLVVSEMSLLQAPLHNSFQREKAHLLFQSNYFLTTNDTASALKVFYQLDAVFEKHYPVWKDQPSDYISMLEGILDSLRTLGRYSDLTVFLNKLKKLQVSSSAAQLTIDKIVYVYELILLLDTGEFGKAMLLVKRKSLLLQKNIVLRDATQQAEAYLYTALTHFLNNDLRNAQQCLRPVLLENKLFYHLPVYKTFRLIRLLVHYQLQDHQFIHYEARSIKRSMKKENNSYQLEKTVLAFLLTDPLPAAIKERHAMWEKLQPGFELMKKNKYESQLLKIFDFSLWIRSVLTKQSFSLLLKAREPVQ